MLIVDHIENWFLPNMLSTLNEVVIIIIIIIIIIILSRVRYRIERYSLINCQLSTDKVLSVSVHGGPGTLLHQYTVTLLPDKLRWHLVQGLTQILPQICPNVSSTVQCHTFILTNDFIISNNKSKRCRCTFITALRLLRLRPVFQGSMEVV